MKKLTFSALAAILIVGCASTEPVTHSDSYDPDTQARIRLFGRNGQPTIMRYTFNDQNVKINFGGSFKDAFGSFVGKNENLSLGIPQTDVTAEVLATNQMLSKITYSEYIIPADVEVKISSHTLPLSSRSVTASGSVIVHTVKGCSGKTVTIVPKAGTDYEVAPFSSSGGCNVMVFEVVKEGDIVKAIPLQ